MPHKKSKTQDTPDEQAALIERIDDMMDIKRPEATPVTEIAPPKSGDIDIFKDLNKAAPSIATPKPPEPTVDKPLAAPELPKITTHTAPSVTPDVIVKEVQAPIETSNPIQPTPKPAVLKPLPKPAQLRNSFDDPSTDKAVDEITKNEGDAYFEEHDKAAKFAPPVKKQGLGSKIKALFWK